MARQRRKHDAEAPPRVIALACALLGPPKPGMVLDPISGETVKGGVAGIWPALRARGWAGATIGELEDLLGVRYDKVRLCLKEYSRRGYVVASGRYRGRAVVWVLDRVAKAEREQRGDAPHG